MAIRLVRPPFGRPRSLHPSAALFSDLNTPDRSRQTSDEAKPIEHRRAEPDPLWGQRRARRYGELPRHHHRHNNGIPDEPDPWLMPDLHARRRQDQPRVSPLHQRTRAVADPRKHGAPIEPRYFAPGAGYDTILPPRVSPGIQALESVHVDFVREGLLLASSPSGPTPPDDPMKDPFHVAVVCGFAESCRFGLDFEFSYRKDTMDGLVKIVQTRLRDVHDRGAVLSPDQWAAAKAVLVQAGTRPTMDSVGEWAWEELRRGAVGWARLFEVWQGIHEVVPKRRQKMLNVRLDKTTVEDAKRSLPGEPIPLNARFFTALVAAASALDSAPPLRSLVYSLVNSINSFVSWTDSESGSGKDTSALDTLPDAARARYYIRAVELAYLFRSPLSPFGPYNRPTRSLPPPGGGRVTSNLEHVLKRAGDQHEIAYLCDMWRRIREAVDGLPGATDGWLEVDWHEPVMQLGTAVADAQEASAQEDRAEEDTRPHVALTQSIVGGLLASLGKCGQWDVVMEIADWASSQRTMGMSLYLWTNLLRGLASKGDPVLVEKAYRRMVDVDGIEPDVIADCALLQAYLANPRARAAGDDQTPPDLALGLERANAFLHSPDFVRRYGSRPPMALYNVVLAALLGGGMHGRAREMLDELLALGHEPSIVTFNHFLSAQQRRKMPDFAAVSELLEMIKRHGLTPDVATYSMLANLMLRKGDADVNDLVKPLMAGQSAAANSIMYGSLIHHLSKSGNREDLESALKLLNTVDQRKRGGATEITYTSLIMGFLRAHRRSGQPHETSTELRVALRLVDRMRRSGVSLNRVGYHALIHSLLEVRSPPTTELALDLFERFRADRKRNGSALHATTYVIVLEKMLAWGEKGLARRYALQARNDGVKGTSAWFDRLMENALVG